MNRALELWGFKVSGFGVLGSELGSSAMVLKKGFEGGRGFPARVLRVFQIVFQT